MCEACWCAACARGGTAALPSLPGPGQAAQSPIAKMSSSRVVCSVGRTTSWLMRLVSSPARSFRKSGALTPAAQTTSSAGITRPSASRTPSRHDLGHRGAGVHFHTQLAQQLCRGAPTGAAAAPAACAVGCLDHDELDVLLRIDAVQSEGHHFARGAVQLRGELDAGGAGADDGDVQLLRPQRRVLRMRADAGVDQARGESAARRPASRAGSHARATPGVPKSLLWLPTAMTSVS